jgi:DNA polymerase-1
MPAKTDKKRIILLDSHAILHRAYHALPDFMSSKGEPTGALFGLATMLFSIINELKPDYIIAAFDLPKPTYRHEAYADYKAGRRETDNDLKKQFNRAREMFQAFNIPIYEKEGFEADDVLGTIVEETKNNKEIEIIIASGDMDTLQLVDKKKVQVYTLKKGIKDTILYDEKAVKERFEFDPAKLTDYKGLRGDPSDNIIGVAGIGDKTATTLIKEFGTLEKIYKKLEKVQKENKEYFEKLEKEELDKKDKMSGAAFEEFINKGIKERIVRLLIENREEAEFSKMLATIRRDAPIEFVIPEKTWRDSIDPQKVKDLFRELDFRTLVGRFNNVLGIEEDSGDDDTSSDKEEEKIKLDQKEVQKVALALWVIDSNSTNPDLEDIYGFTKTKNPSEFEKAKKIIFDEIKKRGLEFVYEKIELPLISVIEEMENNGVKLDKDKLKKLSTEYHKELDKIQSEIYKMAGEEFNINSPKQMSEVLFEKMELTYKGMRKTSTGKYSTKEEVLHKLTDAGHEIAVKILEYREFQKLLSTYIDSLPNHVKEDGRLHATFSQTGTTTGRLSSNDPNLQNIPVGSDKGRKIRESFVAEKGNVLVSFDYSQIELRIAAFLSGDEKLIDAFKKGLDIHTSVAAEVFDVDPEKVEKEQRRQAKVINFGILYGMGVSALQKNLGTDRKTAQEFYNKYFESYPGVASYVDKIKKETAVKKYTETIFGRRRYFEGFNSPLPFIRAQAERMAINAPIQGSQADMIKIAMVKIDDYLKKEKLMKKAKLILQIHDEVIYEIDQKLLEETVETKHGVKSKFEADIYKIMESILTTEQTKGVPILVESVHGNNWGELK